MGVPSRKAALSQADFLANISHEIRTPINTIVGMAELLKDTPLTPEQKKFVHTLSLAAGTLVELVDDILDFSKIENGHLELESIPFELKDVIEKTLGLTSVRAQQKGLELSLQMAPDVPQILVGDPNRLRQVLVNLIGNAVKFTEKGKVSLTVRRTPSGSPSGPPSGTSRGHLTFTVTDTGIGMTDDHMKKIFRPFTQADTSISRRFGGTGLGLSISKQLVERMGGQISVTSQEGHGSQFSFTVTMGTQDHLLTPKNPRASMPTDTRRLRILIVDDHEISQLLLKTFLKDHPYLVSVASDGESGVKAYKRDPQAFDLILMDMQMPVMDGAEATRSIRAFEASKKIRRVPIIALSAHAMVQEIRRSLEAGCTTHLTKPIKKDQLFQAILTATSPQTSSHRKAS